MPLDTGNRFCSILCNQSRSLLYHWQNHHHAFRACVNLDGIPDRGKIFQKKRRPRRCPAVNSFLCSRNIMSGHQSGYPGILFCYCIHVLSPKLCPCKFHKMACILGYFGRNRCRHKDLPHGHDGADYTCHYPGP